MADENKDLIFPMHLDIDVQSFEKSWKEAEPQLQAVLDRKPLEAKLNVDLTGVQKSIELFQKIQEMGMAPKQSTQAAILIAQKKTEIMSENQALKVRQQNVIETNKLRISNANAEKSELALERAKQRGISAVHTQNKAYQAQRGLLNGLPQFVNSYISILGAYRLGQNIVDTTAEFEMQRVALAAIIQNKQKADELFAKDVELGLQSPFQIKELITYTKQLAAYRIESDSLFETTKRLADISAGLGVDMSRLVLAYGQVKAASVLRGQELRQFTEAGIPLIQLLADKFTKLNGVATTTGDVFKLISEREVSFEMVKSVFDDLTNAGGAFYRMQEIQAQTLKGSLSNLKDAYQKMFMQIGNENMGPMKGVIEGIKELMSNWRVIGEVATDVAVGYGVAKLAILAYNAALGKENAMNIASIMAAKKKEAALLTQASAYRKLEFGEALRLLSAKKMTAIDWEQLIIDKKLNGDMALRLVATKKMTVEDAKSIAVKLGLKDAEIAHAASMGRTKAIMMMATATVKAYTAAIWASTKALLTNPLTWALVAAAGLVKLISHIVSYNKEYSDMAKNIRKESALLANEMSDAFQGMSETIAKGFAKGASNEAMVSARKSLQDILEKNELIKDILEVHLGQIYDEAKRLDIVKEMWDTVHAAAASGKGGDMAAAQKATGGLLDKDVVESAELLSKKLAAIDEYLADMGGKGYNISGLRKEFEAIKTNLENGELSLSGFNIELLNLLQNPAATKNATLFEGLEKRIDKATFAAWNLNDDMMRFTQNTINRIGDINGEKIIPFADKLGLSQENLLTFQTRIATETNLWIQSLGDIDAAAKKLLITQVKLQNQFPFRPAGEPETESNFQKSYNAYITKMGFTEVPSAVTKEGGEPPKELDIKSELEKIKKDSNDRVKVIDGLLQNGKIKTAEYIAELKKEKITLLKKISETNTAWRQFFGGTEKPEDSNAKTTDPRIAILKNQVSLIQEAYSKYLEYSKLIGEEEAKRQVTKQYGGQNKPISGITKTGLPLVFSQGEIDAMYAIVIPGFEKMGEDGQKAAKAAFIKHADLSFDEMKRTIQANLDKLAADIEQTQRANEFYEKMLGLTGSKDAAEKLTKAMGMTVGDARKDMQKALGATMKVGGVDYGAGVNLTDVNAVQKAIKKMREAKLKDSADSAQKQLDILVDYEKKQLEEIYSGLEDYMTAEQKKVKIAADTQRRIEEIEANPNISPEQKTTYIAAAKTEGAQKTTKIGLEELQKTDEYIRAFEDLSRVGGATLDSLYTDLERLSKQTGLSATDLKTIKDLMEKIRLQKESANPFEAWSEGITKYKQAIADLDLYSVMPNSNEYKAAQDLLMDGASKMEQAAKNIQTAFQTTTSPLEKTISLIEEVADGLGLAFSDDTKDLIDSFMKGFKIMSDAMEVANSILALNTMVTNINTASKVTLTGVNAGATASEVALAIGAQGATVSFGQLAVAIWAALAPLWPLLLAGAALGAIFAIINAEAKKQEKIQEALTKKIKALDEAYQQLERSAERAVGSDYLKKMQEQRINLLEREKIALEKARTVRDKKGRIDAEKSLEYYKEAVKYRQEADDLVEEIRQKLTGYSYVAEAASDFSSAWLDAYISFENTADAINDKFKEMINKMIVESFLASIIAKELKPVFDAIDEAFKDSQITAEELKNIDNLTATATIAIDAKSQAGMEALRRGGIDVRASKESLSGISASVASMSEDTANTLGGYFNSGLMQWVKQTGLQTQILAAIQAQDVKTPLANMYKLQQESLATINAIKTDTAIMVSRLNTLVENQNSTMISGGQKAVNVRLLN